MKANELMIGNYVQFLGKVRKIRSIVRKDTWIEISFDGKNPVVVSLEEIEPIPLTPEILEKNFEKKTFYGIYDDYFNIDIREYSDGLYIVTYHSCEFNIPDQTIHLSWVHELQNFMRHCGIDKTIEL